MDKRSEEVRRDPLDGGARNPDPLAGDPGFDAATESFRPEAINHEALNEETEVDEIKVTRMEIERTRAQMSETTDAIQNRLSAENMKEQAKDRVRKATVGKAEGAWSTMMDTIRQNPMPAALTGIGLTWLFMSGKKQDAPRVRYRKRPYDTYGYRAPYDEPSPYDDPRYEERKMGGSSAGEALSRAQDRAGETAGRARDKVGETADHAQDKAGEIVHRTQDQASRLGDQAQHQARRARDGFERMSRENPLAVGALAVGIGAAVGLAIPATGKENRVMGETRDNFVEKTQEKAQEAQQKVQQVAHEAQSAAQQEADNQGLTNQ